jgi:hypothetical protein
MQLGPDEVLLTAAVRFRRGMRIDEVETRSPGSSAVAALIRRSGTSISSPARCARRVNLSTAEFRARTSRMLPV